MIVKVTQEHIYKSNKLIETDSTRRPYRNYKHCPVSQALKLKYLVSSYSLHPKGKAMEDSTKIVDLPARATRFINNFDKGKKVSPLNLK